MADVNDPTISIRKVAATFPNAVEGTSCNQTSFKVGKTAFLYIGPGAKGQGSKAMFKLNRSMAQAKKLAAKEPDRFEVGSTAWVTARFTAEKPLAKSIWEKWLRESYELCSDGGTKGQKSSAGTKTKKKTVRKKATRKKSAR